jgi:penicillin-insensitive murein endopeptidase
MGIFQPKDGRGYFMLPQAPEGAGYYVYGNVDDVPGTGHLGQFAHPAMLSLIFWVERRWATTDARRFGVGNISLANGGKFRPHASHKDGLQVDVRALRLDGKRAGVEWRQADYDRDATARLIAIFNSHPSVRKVYFNDSKVPGVFPMHRHDNHFHVEVRG